MDAPTLRRGLFGYRRKDVRAILTDRDVMIVRASKEAREAEAKVAEQAAELERTSREIVELNTRNHDLESRLRESAERFRAVERSGSPSTTEGLTDVLHAAERALARLTDAARRNAEQELGETERAHEELRSEIEQLATWRERVLPLTDAMLRSIDQAQAATATLASQLASLAETPAPPRTERQEPSSDVIRLGEPEDAAPADAREATAPSPWPRDGNPRANTA
jgi:chromosome segregation ATPase